MKWDPDVEYPEGYDKYKGPDGFWDIHGRMAAAYDDGIGGMLTKSEVDKLVE